MYYLWYAVTKESNHSNIPWLALFERKQDSIEKLLERTIFKWDIFRQQNMVITI